LDFFDKIDLAVSDLCMGRNSFYKEAEYFLKEYFKNQACHRFTKLDFIFLSV